MFEFTAVPAKRVAVFAGVLALGGFLLQDFGEIGGCLMARIPSRIAAAVILIVDDYQDGAEALCRVLGRKGYPCQWVPGGQEALAMIRAHPPEQPLLIVLDEMMPDMSGMDVLREIRADSRIANTTVIFHSAGFDMAKRDEAMTLGVVAWLLKGGTWALELNGPVDTIRQWYERVGGVRRVADERAAGKAAGDDARPH